MAMHNLQVSTFMVLANDGTALTAQLSKYFAQLQDGVASTTATAVKELAWVQEFLAVVDAALAWSHSSIASSGACSTDVALQEGTAVDSARGAIITHQVQAGVMAVAAQVHLLRRHVPVLDQAVTTFCKRQQATVSELLYHLEEQVC